MPTTELPNSPLSPELQELTKDPQYEPILQVLRFFPDEALNIIKEQEIARKEWGKFGQDVSGRIEHRLPNDEGEPRNVLLNSMEITKPLADVIETVNSLRGERTAQGHVDSAGLFSLISVVNASPSKTDGDPLFSRMIRKLLEVMQVDDSDIALLRGYYEADRISHSINTKLLEIRRKKKISFAPNNANEREKIAAEFNLAMLTAEEGGLQRQASLVMEKAMKIINQKYPPKGNLPVGVLKNTLRRS